MNIYLIIKKKKIGSCYHSDISTFSLHPLKTITTCEGGIVTTNDNKLSKKIKLYRSHGIQRSKKFWEYDVKYTGFNLRLSDVQSALGISQLKKINKIIEYRKKLYDIYQDNLNNFKNVISIVKKQKDTNASYHLVIALINFKILKISKDNFLKKLKKKNIFCQVHYIPNYRYKNFKNSSKLVGAEKYFRECVSLPIHLKLKKRDIFFIISEIKNIINLQLSKK